jgi:hypothetical protein
MVPSISFSGRECRHADKIFAFPARTEFSVTTTVPVSVSRNVHLQIDSESHGAKEQRSEEIQTNFLASAIIR